MALGRLTSSHFWRPLSRCLRPLSAKVMPLEHGPFSHTISDSRCRVSSVRDPAHHRHRKHSTDARSKETPLDRMYTIQAYTVQWTVHRDTLCTLDMTYLVHWDFGEELSKEEPVVSCSLK